ncbi:MAG: thioredoxin-dependent thiol peroxidase [Spirochaetae bacterium HGW-Spirochaetae-5]|nr:MAG: thioredoxin-dependent thiol peroxidase [Spirochaetae bacterium HGW-Spirochaetae-5]
MAENKQLKIGNKAPDFKLPDAEGELVSLNDYKDRWLVLYFYPKDSTSGCTTEAVDFTGSLPEFKRLGAAVAGVSPDSCKSHQKFIIKHDLAVTLLSDEEKTVLEKYGVWQMKKMYGKDYFGVVRTTFLIGPDGKIRHIWDKVKVAGHVDEVLAKLMELTQQAL